jgi:hypothetical protein
MQRGESGVPGIGNGITEVLMCTDSTEASQGPQCHLRSIPLGPTAAAGRHRNAVASLGRSTTPLDSSAPRIGHPEGVSQVGKLRFENLDHSCWTV